MDDKNFLAVCRYGNQVDIWTREEVNKLEEHTKDMVGDDYIVGKIRKRDIVIIPILPHMEIGVQMVMANTSTNYIKELKWLVL